MEQRTYHGQLDPHELADFLVQHFDPQPNLQAQKIGEGASNLVQIGRGDVPKDIRHAVTVAISRLPDDQPGLIVTMGQQQWLTTRMATYMAMMGLISVLVTPWALFALLWPLSEAAGSTTLPHEIWNAIDTFLAGQGATLAQSQELIHPHREG
jgi:hypothetical protein